MSIEKFQNNLYLAKLKPLSPVIGAALAITANNPINLIRFRLQTMPELVRQGQLNTPYSGLVDCAKRILKQEKIKGFWKGNFSVLVRFYPCELFNFFLKQAFSKAYSSGFYFQSLPQLAINSLSGVSSGFASITLLYPLDFARLKLANNVQSKKKSIWKTIKTTFQQEGLQGIYRGVMLSYLAMIIFRGVFFGIYDTFKVKLSTHYQKFIMSYGASIASMFLVSPFQTIIRRMMMTSGHSFKYQGYADCVRQIYQSDRFKGFYRGGTIIPLQGLMVGMMFTLFDQTFSETKKF